MSGTNSGDINLSKTYFVNFNQDCTSLSVGSKEGYWIFSLNNIDDIEQIHHNPNEDTRIVERLFSSSLVGVVSLSSPRKLKVCHYKKGTEICNYSYSNAILAVRLNRLRLVVCLEESIYIHNIRDMKVVHTIRDTPPNPGGICALSASNEQCFLAYPGSANNGEVQIFDALNLHAKTMISAHDNPLASIAFCPSGKKIATASDKGTVIRVFSVLDSSKLYEFRRGMKRCVSISCLAFSTCGTFLSCSSNTETVHIFKLVDKEESASTALDENNSSWMGYFATMLPTQVTDVFTQGRAFATAYLPFQNVRNVIAISKIHNEPRLLVATEEGMLYVYNISKEGGELKLYKQHHLDRSAGNPTPSADALPHSDPINIEAKSESERLREMAAATETPPKSAFQFNDDQEYPPLTVRPE